MLLIVLYVVLAYLTIYYTITKEWSLFTIFGIGVGLSFYTIFTVKEVKKVGQLFPFFIYIGSLLILLFVLYLIITAPNRRIKRNAVFKKTLDLFKSIKNAAAVYVCLDGVAICSDINSTIIYESTDYSTSCSTWLYSIAPRAYSVATIPNNILIDRIYYKNYDYNYLMEQLPIFTKELSRSLKLKCYLYKKTFHTSGQVYTTMPTGAVTYNGRTTFTGGTYTSPSYDQTVCFMGLVASKEKIQNKFKQNKPKVKPKKW